MSGAPRRGPLPQHTAEPGTCSPAGSGYLLASLSAFHFLPRDPALCSECFHADCSFCSEQQARALGKAGNLENLTKRNCERLLRAKAVKHMQFPKHLSCVIPGLLLNSLLQGST